MSGSYDLDNYIVFFESEPEWVHEMGWFYGARFSIANGQDIVLATIAPDEGEFSLEWHQAGRCLMKLKLVMVEEWLLQRVRDKEQLLLKARLDRKTLCVVTLRPEIAVELEVEW